MSMPCLVGISTGSKITKRTVAVTCRGSSSQYPFQQVIRASAPSIFFMVLVAHDHILNALKAKGNLGAGVPKLLSLIPGIAGVGFA